MSAPEAAAPTYVLWLGDDVAAPRRDLAARGVTLATAPSAITAREIATLAPDLIVVGGASAERAETLARELEGERPMSPPPIVLLEAGADTELARRYGVVARLDAGLAAPALAARIEALLAKIASSQAQWSLSLGPGALDEFVTGAREDRRAGVLLCGSPPAAIAFTPDGACAPSLASMIARTAGSEALTLRFYERPLGRFVVLAAGEGGPRAEAERIDGLAAIVIDGGGSAWSALAGALGDLGAAAQVVAARKEALEGARTADPAVIVAPTSALATPAGRALLEDARLASAALVVLAPERLAKDGAAVVAAAVSRACAVETALRARALEAPMIERVETLGPARWLKTLARTDEPIRMRVRAVSGEGELVLAAGRIKDATFTPRDRGASALRGAPAVRAVVATGYGTLLAGRADAPIPERPVLAARAVTSAARPGAVAAARAGSSGGTAQRGAIAEKLEARAQAAAAEHEESTAVAELDVLRAKLVESAHARDSRPARSVALEARAASSAAAMPAAVVAASPSASGTRPARGAPAPMPAELPRDEPAGLDEEDEDDEPTMLAMRPASLAALAPAQPAATGAPSVAEVAPPAAEPSAPPVATTVSAPASRAPRSRALPIVIAASIAVLVAVGVWASGVLESPSSLPAFGAAAEAQGEAQAETEAEAEAETEAEAQTETETEGEAEAEAAAPTVAPEASEAPSAGEATASPAPSLDGPVVDARAAARIVLEADRAMRSRQYQRALQLADEALALDPTNARAVYDHAVATLRLGGDAEALEWAERGAQLDRTEPLFWLLIGDIHLQNGRRIRARDAWQRCLAITPDHASCSRRLGVAPSAAEP